MDQKKFIEVIEKLRDYALEHEGKIAKIKIEDALTVEGMDMTEEQLRMVYAYLKTSKVTVLEDEESLEEVVLSKEEASIIEPTPVDEDIVSEEEREEEFIQMYRDDIKNVKVLSDEELYNCMRQLAEKKKANQNIKNEVEQITQSFLKDVLRWVKTYEGGALLMADLIQEGNIGLMSAVAEFDYDASLHTEHPVKKLRDEMKKGVLKYVQEAVFDQESENNVGYKIAGRVNAVNETAKKLHDDYGRNATIDEVAEEMGMTYEEVKEIVDLAAGKIEFIDSF